MVDEEVLKIRIDKVKKWFKEPSNKILFAILVFAFAIRLYYFVKIGNQPVWWDEAEYLLMARSWAFGLDYNFFPVRPVMFSLITSILFRISYSEILPRLMIFLFSMASVLGMYLLGKEIWDKRVGLIAAFFMSVSYLSIFHTYRLLVDLPSLTFYIFSALFFFKYFKTGSNKMLYWAAIIIGFGTLFRITTSTLLIAMGIYVLITERFNCLKKKEYYIAAIIFGLILSPYIIWGYQQFGGFVISQAGAWNAPQEDYLLNGLRNLNSYKNMFPYIFSWPVLSTFILGLFSMYPLIIGFDLLIKGKNPKLNKYFLLILLFLIPLIIVSLSFNNYFEDRYILNSFPSVFIISGILIFNLYDRFKIQSKNLAIISLIVFLVLAGFYQINQADQIIKSRSSSYYEFKESGNWLKENTEKEDIIITDSWPMTGYYSERKTIVFTETKEEFEKLKNSDQNIKYFMISAVQKSPEWTYSYPQENNLTIAKVYTSPANKEQAIIILYRLK